MSRVCLMEELRKTACFAGPEALPTIGRCDVPEILGT
jgi:hypothetical protein